MASKEETENKESIEPSISTSSLDDQQTDSEDLDESHNLDYHFWAKGSKGKESLQKIDDPVNSTASASSLDTILDTTNDYSGRRATSSYQKLCHPNYEGVAVSFRDLNLFVPWVTQSTWDRIRNS